jgi:Relaxase/Mobilisation nuclease domain/Large polyvalent protein-associated domain 7
MIAKHIPMKSSGKSSFAGLAKYLTDTQNKNERVGDLTLTNCVSVDLDSAILEVLNTQSINKRAAGDKTYHLLISFAPDEKVTDKQLRDIEKRFADVLGFSDHQRISVVHHDSDSLHIHLAINKVHPKKHTFYEPFRAYKAMSDLCAKIEDEYGLVKVNHQARKTKSENLADDMERHTGVETLLNWIKRNCADELREANDWQEFKNTLDANGLSIRVKANGFVIETYERLSVKASSVDREFSKQNLEKKFGAFVDEERKHKAKPQKHYVEKPLSKGYDTTELYALYKKHQSSAVDNRIITQAIAKDRKAHLIKSAKLSAKAKREALKLMNISRESKKVVYKAISNSLIKKINAINTDYRNSNKLIYNRCKKQSWADWLRTQAMAGNQEAVKALRARSYSSNLVYNTITGNGKNHYVSPIRDSITKEGVVIYSNKYFSIRDDGKHIKVSRGVSYDGVTAALRVAVAKYGEVIKLDGDKDFKDQVILAAAASGIKVSFSDKELNAQLTAFKDKYKDELRNRRRNPGGFGKPFGWRNNGTGRGMAGSGTTKETARKPNASKHPEPPPTQRHHGLRELRDVVMAFDSRRTKVLLPGDVLNNLDNSKPGNNNDVRRKPQGKKR